ncbi:MAG TPA: universal stress protein, partial [Microthrixaceae bacterium]|nr:universal stress protein [Microthrixaceae bacterium]
MAQPNTHHRVIVGVDGSSSALMAVRWAAREAVLRSAPLTVVHIIAAMPIVASALVWPAGRVPEEFLEIQESEARDIIADAMKTAEDSVADDRVEVTSEQYLGAPVSALVELSKDAQMVVVARRGRSGKHRRLLGSVSTGLLHHAHCPVAVIHDEAQPPQVAHLPVLVGIDGSKASEAATAIAFDEASWRGVDLVALHIWSDADMTR